MCVCVYQKMFIHNYIQNLASHVGHRFLTASRIHIYTLGKYWAHTGLGVTSPLKTCMAPHSSLDGGYFTNGVTVTRAPIPRGNLNLSRALASWSWWDASNRSASRGTYLAIVSCRNKERVSFMYLGEDIRGYLGRYPRGLCDVMYTHQWIINVMWP